MAVGLVEARTPPQKGPSRFSPVSVETNVSASSIRDRSEDRQKPLQFVDHRIYFFLFGGIIGILLSYIVLRPTVLRTTPIALLTETEEVSRQTLLAVSDGQSQTQRVLAQVEEMNRSIQRLEEALRFRDLKDSQIYDYILQSQQSPSKEEEHEVGSESSSSSSSLTKEDTHLPDTIQEIDAETLSDQDENTDQSSHFQIEQQQQQQQQNQQEQHWWQAFGPLKNLQERRQRYRRHRESLLHAPEVIPAGGSPALHSSSSSAPPSKNTRPQKVPRPSRSNNHHHHH